MVFGLSPALTFTRFGLTSPFGTALGRAVEPGPGRAPEVGSGVGRALGEAEAVSSAAAAGPL